MAQFGNTAGSRIAMIPPESRRLNQFVHDVTGCGLIGIAHA
jgi:hypothetical protein